MQVGMLSALCVYTAPTCNVTVPTLPPYITKGTGSKQLI